MILSSSKRIVFKAGGTNETWQNDVFRDGEVKWVGNHDKIDVKTISGRNFRFHTLCLLVKKCQTSAFRIHKMSNTNEKRFKNETK